MEVQRHRSLAEREAWVRQNEGTRAWVRRHHEVVDWLTSHGWSGEEGAAYVCVSLGGLLAIGDAMRRRSSSFSASTHRLCESLWRRAMLQPPAPLAYRFQQLSLHQAATTATTAFASHKKDAKRRKDVYARVKQYSAASRFSFTCAAVAGASCAPPP